MVTENEPAAANRPQAPGALGIIEDFVNTNDIEGAQEYLVRPESLAKWLQKWDFVAARPALSEVDLARARQFREALRALLLANTGEPLDSAALATLDQVARAAPLVVGVVEDGTARLEPAGAGIDAAFGRLLAIVYTAMADGTWSRLKACRSQSCKWAFYDASKNRSGVWCTMAVCGNRNKVRAYQRRRAASPA